MKNILVSVIALAIAFSSCVVCSAEGKQNFFSFGLEYMLNNIKSAVEASEKENSQQVAVPRTAEDIVTVVSCRKGLYNDEDVYLIEYCMNGVVQKEPLVAEEDCQVNGIKSSMEELACGDMIVIDTVFDETVDFIRVVISLDNIDANQMFNEQISVPEKAAWYLYGAKNNAKNEVYFGYILKTKVDNGKNRLIMANNSGKMAESEIFDIPESACVSIYNAYKKDVKARFEKTDIYEIEASNYPDVLGDVDFENENFSADDMKYAFVYINRGEIKEIILVNYSK